MSEAGLADAMGVPVTRFAETERGAIAFQVVGDGPVTILVCKGPALPVDMMCEEPSLARFVTGLASFSRSVWFDPLGSGSSDAAEEIENRLGEGVAADMDGVLDELGCERAVVLDLAAAFPSILFSATHPERTQALVLHNPMARVRRAPDYPQGVPDEFADGLIEQSRRGEWRGSYLSPALAGNERFVQWWERCGRLSMTPTHRQWRARTFASVDVRSVLPTIHVPTLVCVQGPPFGGAPMIHEYVAEHIEGARTVQLPGDERLFYAGNCGPLLDAIEEFVTGDLPMHPTDRVLATIMFTDLVASTEHTARIGDRHWKELLAAHDSAVRNELQRWRGREIKSTGDGVLATFDGPGRALRCAAAIRDSVRSLGVELRIGLHTGEIEERGDDIGGIAVAISKRVEEVAPAGGVLVTRTVVDLVAGSGIEFTDYGVHQLKGVPDTWHLYQVT
jgi:class 3 adenylate cyclase/pimeloyl-ACP methyl ester carboxylesterase